MEKEKKKLRAKLALLATLRDWVFFPRFLSKDKMQQILERLEMIFLLRCSVIVFLR